MVLTLFLVKAAQPLDILANLPLILQSRLKLRAPSLILGRDRTHFKA